MLTKRRLLARLDSRMLRGTSTLLPQFSTVMSWVVLSCTNRSVTGVSLSSKVKVMVLASL
jgi:hypothetical protein